MSKSKAKKNSGQVVVNKKARRNFEITDNVEAGISLVGTEVKSLRDGQGDLSGSYARIVNGQCWLIGMNISPYDKAGTFGHDPKRDRKLLLHKAEIRKLWGKIEQKGFTLIPLKVYFNSRGIAKVELGVGRGKHKYDKRKDLAEKQQKRDIKRMMKKYKR
jgi:SsrA-binding protein